MKRNPDPVVAAFMTHLKEKTWYPVAFMFIITLVLSTILIIFGGFTRERVRANEQIAFERAVLEVLPRGLADRTSPSEIHRLFVEKIHAPTDKTAGAYTYMEEDSLFCYIVLLEGPGFWASIKGVVGIGADTATVTGIAFYEQNETPGLGGEIVKPLFRDQYVGKKIAPGTTPLEMRMPSMELDEHSVHAITGATQTSTRLGRFMNEQLAAWLHVMTKRD